MGETDKEKREQDEKDDDRKKRPPRSFFERNLAVVLSFAGVLVTALITISQVITAQISKDKELAVNRERERLSLQLQDKREQQEHERALLDMLVKNNDLIFDCGDTGGRALLSFIIHEAPPDVAASLYQIAVEDEACGEFELKLASFVTTPYVASDACQLPDHGHVAVRDVVEYIEKQVGEGNHAAAAGCSEVLIEASRRVDEGYAAYPELALAFAKTGNGGRARELLDRLNDKLKKATKRRKEWFASPETLDRLAADLEKIAPELGGDSGKLASSMAAEARSRAKQIRQTRSEFRCTQAALDAKIGIDDLIRHIDAAIEKKDYGEAAACLPHMQKLNVSGSGYSAYPRLIFALDQAGQPDKAKAALVSLEGAIRDHVQRGHGYLAAPQNVAWIVKGLEAAGPQLRDPSLKTAIDGAVKTIRPPTHLDIQQVAPTARQAPPLR